MEMDQLQRLLTDLGCENLKLNSKGTDWAALCPLHMETRRSFAANAEKEVFNCYGCGASGSLAALVMRIKKWQYKQAKAFLGMYGGESGEFSGKGDFLFGAPEWKKEIEIPQLSSYVAYITPGRQAKARKYLESRGVVYREIGIPVTGHELGYDPKSYRVMFPWYDDRAVFRGCTSRLNFNPQSKELVRYLPYFGLQKGEHLFWGHMRWKKLKPQAYCIVEGEIDAILISQLFSETGIVAFALGEARATRKQLDLLSELGGPFLIGLDSDEAGKRMVQFLQDGLKKCVSTVLDWPCKDPGECSKKQLLHVLKKSDWLGRKTLHYVADVLHFRNEKGGNHGASDKSHGAVHQAPKGVFVCQG